MVRSVSNGENYVDWFAVCSKYSQHPVLKHNFCSPFRARLQMPHPHKTGKNIKWQISLLYVALGVVVVSVFANAPKVRGFKPSRGRWILRVIKCVARLPSEGKYSRRSHVVDLRHVKEPYEHEGARRQNSADISHPCFPASPRESLVVNTRCLWWLNQGV
jgi:hypothetical protein